MENDITLLDSQYSKLNAMGINVEGQIEIEILISLLTNHNEYYAIVASLSTLQEEMMA